MLHITSWDKDHCDPREIQNILRDLKPSRVEVPGYNPRDLNKDQSTSSKESWKVIWEWNKYRNALRRFTPEYLASLLPSSLYGNSDIVFWPQKIDKDNANNNSTVILFRGGAFNLLSPGDIESQEAANTLMGRLGAETHVLVLPHHGSEHGIITRTLLQHLKPSVAVATANFRNKFDHPRQSVRNSLSALGIPLCTTKMGDVIVECIDGRTAYICDYKWNASAGRFVTQKTGYFYV